MRWLIFLGCGLLAWAGHPLEAAPQGKRELSAAERLARQQNWYEARQRFAEAGAAQSAPGSPARWRAFAGSYRSALELGLNDEAFAELERFVREAAGTTNEVRARELLAEFYANHRRDAVRDARGRISWQQDSPGERVEIPATPETLQREAVRRQLAEHEARATTAAERRRLRQWRLQANLDLVRHLLRWSERAGPSFWDEDRPDVAATTWEPSARERRFDRYSRPARSGTPRLAEGVLVVPEVPESYRAGLGWGRKILFLLRETADLDDTPSRMFAAEAGHLRGEALQSALAGLPEEEVPQSASADDAECALLIGDKVRQVRIPPSAQPLAIWRETHALYPTTAGGARALLAAAERLQGRGCTVEALALLGQPMPGADRSTKGRALYLRKNALRTEVWIAAGESFADALSNQTLLAGTPLRVAFRVRNSHRLEFQAQRLDYPALEEEGFGKEGRVSVLHSLRERKDLARFQRGAAVRWSESLKEDLAHQALEGVSTGPVLPVGFYLVTARPGAATSSFLLIQVIEQVLVVKGTPQGNLLLTVDARSGQPKGNVPLRLLTRQENDRKVRHSERALRTDAEGLLNLPSTWPASGAIFAAADRGAAGVTLSWQREPAADFRVHRLITDRPVYRPGSTVRFRFWQRLRRDNSYLPPTAGERIKLDFWKRGQGAGRLTYEGVTDATGGCSGEMVLPTDVELGEWGYTFEFGAGNRTGSVGGDAFRVEEYRKPEFEVTVEAPRRQFSLGERTTVRLGARYLFGAPVAGKILYRIVRSDYTYGLPEEKWKYAEIYAGRPGQPYDYPWFRPKVALSRAEERRRYERVGWRDVVLEGERELGADGTIELPIDSAAQAAEEPEFDHNYAIEAEVTDVGRRTLRGEGSVVAARTDFLAELRCATAWLDGPGEATVRIRTARLDGTPVEVTGEVNALRLSYHGAGGDEIREEALGRWTTTTAAADGVATLRAPLAKPGQYFLRFQARDGRGKPVEARTMIWVLGGEMDAEHWRTPPLELVPERDEYRVGDVARVLLVAGQPGCRVLLGEDESRSQLRSWRFVQLTSRVQIVEVPITAHHVPSLGLGATTVRDGALHTAAAKLLVPPTAQLQVGIETDKPSYGPGETVRMRVEARTADGAPAEGAITLRAFDDALQAYEIERGSWLTSFLGDPVSAGAYADCSLLDRQGRWRRGQRDSSPPHWDSARSYADEGDAEPARVIVTGSYVPAPTPPPPLVSASAGEVGRSVRVRRDFADTACWLPSLQLSREGRAEAEFRLPDTVTRWRIQGVAMTPQTALGTGEATMQSTRHVVVRLQAPRFVIEGDEVVLAAVAHNDLPRIERVRGLLLVPADLFEPVQGGEATQAVDGTLTLSAEADLPAGGQHRFEWRLRALRPGLARVLVQALGATESDAMAAELPLLAHGLEERLAQSGSFGGGEEGSRTLQLELPREIVPGKSRLELVLTPSHAGALLEALPYLVEYPYGCVEQTVSRFFPALVVRGLLAKLGTSLEAVAAAAPPGPPNFGRAARPPLTDATLDKLVEEGLRRLKEWQRPDGGWGWWAADEPSVLQTAYVLLGLAEAAGLGDDRFDLRPLRERGHEFLRKAVRNELRKPARLRHLGDRSEQAFAAYVLSLDQPSEPALRSWLSELYDRRADLGHQGRALLALALQRAGLRAEAALTLRNLLQFVERDAATQSAWIRPAGQRWWSWQESAAETNAWTLRAVLAVQPKSELAPALANWLIRHRGGGGYWRNTRETALAICAVREQLLATGESLRPSSVEVSIDGGPPREFRFAQGGLTGRVERVVLTGADLGPGAHTITLTKSGAGALHYSASLDFFSRESDLRPTGDELRIERSYFALGPPTGPGGERARTPLASGDFVKSAQEIEVVLEITAKNTFDYLAFEDRKPAGCEPVGLFSGGTYAEGFCANVELRDTKTVFFVGELRQGRQELRYRVRAEAPGRFRAPPPTAFGMYAPELRAHGATHRWEVRE
ncbi:MAG: hypothetical protein JSR82_02730 [Verrucomicrobia bacterium]|nr:hypothetical protein [Verrucomicrobiota bacterium]